jgi:hypothetical protein
MANTFGRGIAPARENPETCPLTVVVLSDREHPHNIRIVGRRDGKPRLCLRATITLDANSVNYAMAETCTISWDDTVIERLVAGPALFVALTSEEFERRYGCLSSIPT